MNMISRKLLKGKHNVELFPIIHVNMSKLSKEEIKDIKHEAENVFTDSKGDILYIFEDLSAILILKQ